MAAKANTRLRLVDSPQADSAKARSQEQHERQVELRLHEIEYIVAELTKAPYLSLLQERDAIREALEELAVKTEALRWIVRIAKYSEGEVRETLWRDIEGALGDLERLEERIADTECRSAIPAS